MSASNKLIFSLAQNLTDSEKYQGRANIGALSKYRILPVTLNHTVTQQEAASGQFSFSVNATQAGLYLLSLHLYVSPDGTKPNENLVPLLLDVTRHSSSGGSGSLSNYATTLTRLEQNGPHSCRVDIFQNVYEQLSSLEFVVNSEPYKIPQNTPVKFDFFGAVLGNYI